MNIEIIGRAVDKRAGTRVFYAMTTIEDYLKLIGDDFEDFFIQRKREKHKAYKRMRGDITKGALLPSITLAVKKNVATAIDAAKDDGEIKELLSQPGSVNILDGLQRTYILKDLASSGDEFDQSQTLLLEFWIETNIHHLIYRIIVLNAGQKPMSMRHQVELLFLTVKDELESSIDGLEIYTEREGARRRGARRFALDRIATAYQCFLTQNTVVSRDNLVAQKMLDSKILESTEEVLGDEFEKFRGYLEIYAALDDHVCRVYSAEDKERGIPTGANWFGNEIVMNSFFAAVSSCQGSEKKKERCKTALREMARILEAASPGDDPLGLGPLHELLSGIPLRKVNVGNETRRILFVGFKEYFRDEGDTPFDQCWLEA